MVREKFLHTPDVVRLETHTMDEQSVANNYGNQINQSSEMAPQEAPQLKLPSTSPQTINNKEHATPSMLSPLKNEVFMFPSHSQSSDMLSLQHETSKSLSVSSRIAETEAFNNFDPENLSEGRKEDQPQHKNHDNCALETTNDRIDEDMLSAWWFLGSRSDESLDFTDSKKKSDLASSNPNTDDEELPAHHAENSTIRVTSIGSRKHSNTDSVSTWMLRSSSSERTHSLRVKGANSSSSSNVIEMSQVPPTTAQKAGFLKKVSSFISNKQPQPKGGDYTRKELLKRNEWIVGLGGTVNYDQPYGGDCNSVASYQLYPIQKDNLQINTALSTQEDPNKSPDWDPSMLPKQKPPTFEDWTPQDSSYGAAVPACGWVPKRIRKLIEIIFFLAVTALIIFLVVKIGIKLTGNEHKSSSGTDLDLWNDDDHYISNNANTNANDIVDHDDGVYNNNEGHVRIRRLS
jgi:hypothetical protein